MKRRSTHDVALGSLVSVAAHLMILLVLAGWFRVQGESLSTPLAVALWTEPEPSAGPQLEPTVREPAAEPSANGAPDTDGGASPEKEPKAPAAIVRAPSPEPTRPSLPSPGALQDDESSLLAAPHLDQVTAPPKGPADGDRRRRLAEQRDSAAALGARIATRLSEGAERGPAGGAHSPAAVTPSEGDGVRAAEKGVAGPLGERRILYSEKPPYPEWARRMGLEAEVRFRFWVSPDGQVNRVEYVTFSGSTELDRLAERTLRKWRFDPLPQGVPQEDEWGIVPMVFTLIPGNE